MIRSTEQLCGNDIARLRFGHFFYNKENGRPSNLYASVLHRVNEACERHKICKHDEGHFLRVTTNALFLKNVWPNPPADEFILIPSLLHDIGYMLKKAEWNDQKNTAENHATLGAIFLERALRCLKKDGDY